MAKKRTRIYTSGPLRVNEFCDCDVEDSRGIAIFTAHGCDDAEAKELAAKLCERWNAADGVLFTQEVSDGTEFINSPGDGQKGVTQ